MDNKCDKCSKPATIHLTDIVNGKKNEVHLCEECAMAEGLVKASLPLNQLLQGLGLSAGPAGGGALAKSSEPPEMTCEVCGMTFNEFRQQGLLGCPHDYDAFAPALEALVERAQEGSAHHMGKVPHKAGLDQKRATALLSLRAKLRMAVAQEDYERAAALRDQIKELENG